jgi:hypothetical protein
MYGLQRQTNHSPNEKVIPADIRVDGKPFASGDVIPRAPSYQARDQPAGQQFNGRESS